MKFAAAFRCADCMARAAAAAAWPSIRQIFEEARGGWCPPRSSKPAFRAFGFGKWVQFPCASASPPRPEADTLKR